MNTTRSPEETAALVFRFSLICAPSPIFLLESVREGGVKEGTKLRRIGIPKTGFSHEIYDGKGYGL